MSVSLIPNTPRDTRVWKFAVTIQCTETRVGGCWEKQALSTRLPREGTARSSAWAPLEAAPGVAYLGSF